MWFCVRDLQLWCEFEFVLGIGWWFSVGCAVYFLFEFCGLK